MFDWEKGEEGLELAIVVEEIEGAKHSSSRVGQARYWQVECFARTGEEAIYRIKS